MSARWFFSTGDEIVRLQCRLEGDGMIGDALREIKAGESFYGLPFAALQRAGAGVVKVDARGTAKIVRGEGSP